MKFTTCSILIIMFFTACDSSRVFEDNHRLEGRYWHIDSIAAFQFQIPDPSAAYNVKINIRNAFDYPFHNLFYQYHIKDSLGRTLSKKLEEIDLFNAKTGKPLGNGIGSHFDHQQEILTQYSFPSKGKYSIELQQYMRKDSLPLILSVGARVEKSVN